MINKIILNITTLSSILLFSACSNSQEKIKQESIANNVSIYKIMGITQASNHISEYPKFTPVKTHPRETYKESVSQDITYISYKKQDHPNYHKLQQIQNIENKAKSFLGTPYVWGATGPSKFDCSGFTQWVYRDSGINIPRVSRDQARVGQFIDYDNLQRGDMVFFDTKKKRTGRVSHVGIYLGNNDFIHASSAGKSVVIYNFNEKTFYKKRFLWGRRVLKPNFHYALN
jgi:cell wall-associated NlpC family hydrolase